MCTMRLALRDERNVIRQRIIDGYTYKVYAKLVIVNNYRYVPSLPNGCSIAELLSTPMSGVLGAFGSRRNVSR